MNRAATSNRLARQTRLDLNPPPSISRDDFVVSASNAAAVAALDSWPAWPGGRLALVGPEGSGKTHLARAWAARADAATHPVGGSEVSALRGRAVLVEDADRGDDDEALFHLINMAGDGTSLLLTARTLPGVWSRTLPDLRSRLKATPVAQLGPPDDVVLAGVMVKLFRERNIRPADDVLPYLIHRIERSIPAVIDVISRIDELAAAQGRDITRALARQILECEDKALDLFD